MWRPIVSRSAVCAVSVPDRPEHDCVHVHGNGVLRESGLRRDVRHAHALVHELRDLVDDGDENEQSRALEAHEASEPQDDGALPLVRDLQGEQEEHADEDGRQERERRAGDSREDASGRER
jgi:hypothetical protein